MSIAQQLAWIDSQKKAKAWGELHDHSNALPWAIYKTTENVGWAQAEHGNCADPRKNLIRVQRN
jgi:hypothetical protein